MGKLVKDANGEKRCPYCDGKRFTGVEYRGTSQDYDGVSEWLCEMCGKRFGRWTGSELTAGDLERRYGGDR